MGSETQVPNREKQVIYIIHGNPYKRFLRLRRKPHPKVGFNVFLFLVAF